MPYSAGYAIADIAALKAFSASDLVNGYARWVISKNTWYGWDANSIATADDDTVVALNLMSTNGRFIKSNGIAPNGNQYNIQSEILKDSPIGYWKLDELSGTIAQNFGSGMSDGIYINSPQLMQAALAYGSNYSVNFINDSSLKFTNTIVQSSTDISIECIVHISSLLLNGAFMSLGQADEIGFGIGNGTYANPGNEFIGLAGNVAWRPSGKTIGLGTHHLGIVYRGASSKEWLFYIDGFLEKTLGGININSPNNYGEIRRFSPGVNHNVTIDEVAIYNKELSQRRWMTHANAVIY